MQPASVSMLLTRSVDPYDGTQITQYEAREFPLELNFVINNKTEDPMPGSTYVGIEIIRLYAFSSVDARVNLYRNRNWVDSMAQLERRPVS